MAGFLQTDQKGTVVIGHNSSAWKDNQFIFGDNISKDNIKNCLRLDDDNVIIGSILLGEDLGMKKSIDSFIKETIRKNN